MKVRAKVLCFVGGSRRRPGDVFEWDGPVSKHLEVVAEPPKEEPKKKGRGKAAPEEELLS